ncbi:MAG: type II toxin-antitoxin system RelE family toxin [Angustibacter sp.]
MTYRVEFTSASARQVKKLPRPTRTRILRAIESLAEEPRPPGARKLAGQATAWRVRTGDYRIIYEVLDDELVITIVRAGHRREVYDR